MKQTLFAAIAFIVTAIASAQAQDTNSTDTASVGGPSKFYGPVTAVDTNAMTFTVGDQTFTVTSESHLTKAGKPATLADAVVGEPARGSYVTASDGKLNVTKARFGKGGGKGGKGGKKNKNAGDNAAETDTNAPAAPPQN